MSYDADFVNPCSLPLTVRTYYEGTSDQIKKATLPPESVTTVKDALHDAAGPEWTIGIDGSERLLTLDRETDGRWLVVIPDAACDEIGNSQGE